MSGQAQDEGLISTEVFAKFVDRCLELQEIGEFELPKDAIERSSRECVLRGKIQIPAPRNDAPTGSFNYDAARKAFIWKVDHIPLGKSIYGGSSPFSILDKKPIISRAEKKKLKKIGNLVSWVLTIYNAGDIKSVYQATNRFGARFNVQKQRGLRYSLAIRTKWKSKKYGGYEVLIFPVDPSIAQDIADHLVFNISFKVERLCSVCFATGKTTMLKNYGPTLSSPYDHQIFHRYMHATIEKVDIVDGRSGLVLASGTPSF